MKKILCAVIAWALLRLWPSARRENWTTRLPGVTEGLASGAVRPQASIS